MKAIADFIRFQSDYISQARIDMNFFFNNAIFQCQ